MVSFLSLFGGSVFLHLLVKLSLGCSSVELLAAAPCLVFFVVISCGVTGLLEVFHALWGWPLIFGVSFRWLGIAIDGWLAHIGCLHAGLFEFWVVAFKVSTLCHYRLLNVDAFCLFMVAASWVLVCGCCCYRMISCGV